MLAIFDSFDGDLLFLAEEILNLLGITGRIDGDGVLVKEGEGLVVLAGEGVRVIWEGVAGALITLDDLVFLEPILFLVGVALLEDMVKE
jgi:hypothetical protein